MDTGIGSAGRTGQVAGRRFVDSRTFEVLSRGGFVARGVVYGLIGVLAVKLALGDGGKATNQQGALQTVAHQPAGHVLLLLVAIGLGGYSLWRLLRALLGRGPESGDDSTVERVGGFGSGVVYAILCAIAIRILAGSGSGGGSASKETSGVLGWPGGQWLVGVAGAVLIVVACYQAYRGVSREFLDDSKQERMRPLARRVFTAAGIVGHLSRTVVFGLVGVFLIKAAVDYRPSKAVGIGGALSKLLREPAGTALLAVVAAGLVAFAVYSLADARYHRI